MIKKLFLFVVSLIIFVNVCYAKEEIKTKLLYSQRYYTEYGYDIKDNELYISFVTEMERDRSTLYKFEKNKLIKMNKIQEEVVAFDTKYEVPEINYSNPLIEISSTTSIKMEYFNEGTYQLYLIKNGKKQKTDLTYIYSSGVYEGYVCADKEREKIYFSGYNFKNEDGIFCYDIKADKFELFMSDTKDRALSAPQRVPGTPYLAYIASNYYEQIFEIWIAEIPEWREEMPDWKIELSNSSASSVIPATSFSSVPTASSPSVPTGSSTVVIPASSRRESIKNKKSSSSVVGEKTFSVSTDTSSSVFPKVVIWNLPRRSFPQSS